MSLKISDLTVLATFAHQIPNMALTQTFQGFILQRGGDELSPSRQLEFSVNEDFPSHAQPPRATIPTGVSIAGSAKDKQPESKDDNPERIDHVADSSTEPSLFE